MTNRLNHDDYVRRETFIATVVSGVMSALLFCALFRGEQTIPIWGMGHLVFDCLPQSFMVAFMTTMTQGHFTQIAIRRGTIATSGEPNWLPKSIVSRAAIIAALAAGLGTAIVAGVATISGLKQLDWLTASAVKAIYGATLALIISPASLRRSLADR